MLNICTICLNNVHVNASTKVQVDKVDVFSYKSEINMITFWCIDTEALEITEYLGLR